MRAITIVTILFSLLQAYTAANAQEFSYNDIASRFVETRLDSGSVQEAKMQGECLVGLKHLNFRKREDFDPVAEWTNYRAISLLEQYPPCKVLIIMEVARSELIGDVDEQ